MLRLNAEGVCERRKERERVFNSISISPITENKDKDEAQKPSKGKRIKKIKGTGNRQGGERRESEKEGDRGEGRGRKTGEGLPISFLPEMRFPG